jgi:uncharacterized membrane protein (DUF373 family)
MERRLSFNWKIIRQQWPELGLYERFEIFVALVLTGIISAVILVALGRLIVSVVDTLVLRSLNPLEHGVFQTVFGEILTVLIALEFNHTLQVVIRHEFGIIQAKIVILIAVLALVRKLIVTDLSALSPLGLAALAALLLALGITYWLMSDRDDRLEARRRRRIGGRLAPRGAVSAGRVGQLHREPGDGSGTS